MNDWRVMDYFFKILEVLHTKKGDLRLLVWGSYDSCNSAAYHFPLNILRSLTYQMIGNCIRCKNMCISNISWNVFCDIFAFLSCTTFFFAENTSVSGVTTIWLDSHTASSSHLNEATPHVKFCYFYFRGYIIQQDSVSPKTYRYHTIHPSVNVKSSFLEECVRIYCNF